MQKITYTTRYLQAFERTILLTNVGEHMGVKLTLNYCGWRNEQMVLFICIDIKLTIVASYFVL